MVWCCIEMNKPGQSEDNTLISVRVAMLSVIIVCGFVSLVQMYRGLTRTVANHRPASESGESSGLLQGCTRDTPAVACGGRSTNIRPPEPTLKEHKKCGS